MIDLWRQSILGQYEAALAMLRDCVDRCPSSAWEAPVANHLFCQSVFHVLFFADLYLGPDVDSLRTQPFHIQHPEFFRDYEEMTDRKPELRYDKPAVLQYVAHCRAKAAEVIAAETWDSLGQPTGFSWLTFSRAELHTYNIRHLQHHVAQLSLRLRLDFDGDVPWCKSGWCEPGE